MVRRARFVCKFLTAIALEIPKVCRVRVCILGVLSGVSAVHERGGEKKKNSRFLKRYIFPLPLVLEKTGNSTVLHYEHETT